MNMPNKSLLILLSFALLAGAGCVSYQETKSPDVLRTQVAFASDRAARLFYEAFTAAGGVGRKTERETCTLLFFTYTKTGTAPGPNALFNEAVQVCDANGDRQITEAEAELFARTWTGTTASK
jgi:hypothetical protein